MKKQRINSTQLIISILINGLIGYTFFYFATGENPVLLGIVTGILLTATGVLTTF